MATQSVSKNIHGPVWPLGLITVASAGTPVRVTSLVDPSATNAPENATSSTSAEYTPRVTKLIFTACAKNTDGVKANTGTVYIMMKGVQGLGNRDDYGTMVMALPQGAATAGPYPTFILDATSINVFSPYAFYIDADNANDGCLVTAVIVD